MSDQTAGIAALEAAMASGELTIEVEGKKVTYRSTAELLQALRYFRDQQAAGTGSGYGSTLATFGAD